MCVFFGNRVGRAPDEAKRKELRIAAAHTYPDPISPVSNPCRNRSVLRVVLSPDEGDATARFHQSDGSRLAADGACSAVGPDAKTVVP